MCAFSLVLIAAPPPLFAAQGTVEDGRALAVEACSACHQVAPSQKRPPPVANPDEGSRIQAPTFAMIAARCELEGDLRAQIANPHYPMREQMFAEMDLDSLARYIRSLAPGDRCPARGH
jgi:hypothetical protein